MMGWGTVQANWVLVDIKRTALLRGQAKEKNCLKKAK
jgi:hypothetical protein